MKNIAIIYHSADFDGRFSNEVCRHWLPQLYPGVTLHSYGWDYGQPLPPLEEGSSWSAFDLIYIVDLSCPEIMDAEVLRERIVWIDHHKSAMDKYDQVAEMGDKPLPYFNGYRIDGVAACRLCWQWFEADASALTAPSRPYFVDREVPEPELIRLAGEYDCWDKRDPDADTLQYGLRTLNDEALKHLIRLEFEGDDDADDLMEIVLQQGRVVQDYAAAQDASIIVSQGYVIRWQGLTFLCCNNARYNSLLFTAGVKPEHDALLGWKFDGKVISVSLYHAPGREHHDLSQIAVKFGGGGHRGACGFKVSLNEVVSLVRGLL